MTVQHKFSIGDKVVFTNDFGVCWGIKTITACETRTYDLWGEDKTVPVYHYEGSDTPWFGVSEENLVLADDEDLLMQHWWFGVDEHFQNKYGFTPTVEQLGGCY